MWAADVYWDGRDRDPKRPAKLALIAGMLPHPDGRNHYRVVKAGMFEGTWWAEGCIVHKGQDDD